MLAYSFNPRYQATKELAGKHILYATEDGGRRDSLFIDTLLNRGAHVHVLARSRAFLDLLRDDFIQHTRSSRLQTHQMDLSDARRLGELAKMISALPLAAVITNLPLDRGGDSEEAGRDLLFLANLTAPILRRQERSVFADINQPWGEQPVTAHDPDADLRLCCNITKALTGAKPVRNLQLT